LDESAHWYAMRKASRRNKLTPDVVIAKCFLSPAEQRDLVERAVSLDPGFYIPRTRWGQAMNLRMNCLGRHWSAKDYKYHTVRTDVDGRPCPPIPDEWQELARRAVIETEYLTPGEYRPFDVCIVNLYAETTGRLGDHVDNSEPKAALASGYPVVSLSIGASCIFRIGGLSRTDPYESKTLQSGDLVIFGRSKRLAYHGVKQVIEGTTPEELKMPEPGRINLTFRVL
jgi:alkylated DNA repair protein (DNA oxidative demethylase)